MKFKVVPVKNITRLMIAAEALLQRAPNMPGMGLLHAPIGYGKTVATGWIVIRTGGVYVRALASASPSDLLASILTELKVQPRGGCARMTRDAVEALSRSQRPLFIDETNNLLDSRRSRENVEIMRDIHDLSTVPVIFIGDETVLPRLQRREQLFSRLSQIVEFKKTDREDLRKIADELCDVKVEDDLLDRIHGAPEIDNLRKMVVALTHAEHTAKAKGLKSIGASAFGSKANLFTNDGAAR